MSELNFMLWCNPSPKFPEVLYNNGLMSVISCVRKGQDQGMCEGQKAVRHGQKEQIDLEEPETGIWGNRLLRVARRSILKY